MEDRHINAGVYLSPMKGEIIHTLILSTAKEIRKRTTDVVVKPSKSSPNYEEYFPTYKGLEKPLKKEVEGRSLLINLKMFNDNLIVEAKAEFDEKESAAILKLKNVLAEECERVAKQYQPSALSEEYTFFCIAEYEDYDKYISANKVKITSLLKDEAEELTGREVEDTISASIRYGKEDTVIIDWDGAFILDKGKEFDEIISLLELANIQLLNLRLLDFKLQEDIGRIRKLIDFGRLKIFQLSYYSKEIVKLRSEALLEFDSIENMIKLYGDWYSARLYGIASRKLSIDKWRSAVEAKLGLLRDIYTIITERVAESYNIILEASIVVLIIVEILLAVMKVY